MPQDEPNSKRLIILVVCAVVVVGAVVAFALFSQAPTPTAAKQSAASPAPAPSAELLPPAPPQITSLPSTPPARVSDSLSPAAQPTTEIPQWETQIDNVLRSNTNESQTAQILLQMLPTLPEDGQIEAANHITNLLPDADYNRVKSVLLNPATSEPVLAVFFTDLMNRDDPTKLRTFLDIAKLPNHPYHEEALSDLQIYVGEDYGTDWTKWTNAVEQYLKTSNAAAAP